jgi:hypothetical protein
MNKAFKENCIKTIEFLDITFILPYILKTMPSIDINIAISDSFILFKGHKAD